MFGGSPLDCYKARHILLGMVFDRKHLPSKYDTRDECDSRVLVLARSLMRGKYIS